MDIKQTYIYIYTLLQLHKIIRKNKLSLATVHILQFGMN